MKEQVFSIYFNPKAMHLAWERMIRSNGRDTKDYFGIELYKVNLKRNLTRLSESLLANKYKPSRPFKYYEPKALGTHRTKTVLSIEDALVYQAIGNVIGQKCFKTLSQNNNSIFGSVLHPEVEQGLELLNNENAVYYFYKFYPPLHNKFTFLRNQVVRKDSIHFKLETDIAGFFDSIPHSKLLVTLHKQFNVERDIVDLLSECLNAWSGTRDAIIPGVGIPQGPAPSHLFANLLLHNLDNILLKEHGFSYFRFMDDIRIYDEDREHLTYALILIDNYLKSRALSINTEKTFIEEIKDKEGEQLQELVVSQGDASDSKLINLLNSEVIENTTGFNKEELDEYTSQQLSTEEFEILIRKEIKEVEIKLSAELEVIYNREYDQLKLLEKGMQRFWTQNAYQWRTLNQILPDFNIVNNDKMIDIWLFGLEHFFWKANHFCWNLNLYGSNENIKSKLLNLLFNKFKYYEWVRYQIISCLSISQKFSLDELQVLKGLITEDKSTELVRIGCYKLLLNHSNPGSELWNTVLDSVSNEKGFYARNVATHAISSNNESQLLNIQSWFGL